MADLTTYRDAVADGLARELRRDPTVVCLGEDIGRAGGVFKTTVGLFEEFGADRVWDTPISEQAIMGAAMGAAMTGMRPVAEIMFSDFLACCWDYLANEIPKARYMTGGQVTVPVVVRTANGGGLGFGAQHSQSVENWALTVPGLKIAAPSTPADVVVETPCRVGKNGATPLSVAALEPRFHGLTSAVKSYELLTIEAAVRGDEEAAMLALMANPLGPDAAHVEEVWDDIKRTNAGLLPTFVAS